MASSIFAYHPLEALDWRQDNVLFLSLTGRPHGHIFVRQVVIIGFTGEIQGLHIFLLYVKYTFMFVFMEVKYTNE